MRIHVIHGPNLNLLGRREQSHYGKVTMEDINEMLDLTADEPPQTSVGECVMLMT